MFMHEMYCGGHMIEAAIAHKRATGKTTFLDVAIKFADHLDNTFGPGKRNWVTGHQEIELALVRLYHETGEERYLDLSYWLLEQRGRGHGVWTRPHRAEDYSQDDVPVAEISNVTGHAVRAMYMYTGMADVAAAMDVPSYVEALERVWESVVHRNMYITGGIGSSRSNEGFTEDYDLPNKTAYCETCASIGMVFWNNRMNLLSGESKYADILERSLYNGVLSGVSLEGDLFFYVNPLESDGDHHRRHWYGTACCPSNIARFIPSVGKYIYLTGEDELIVNLFIGNESNLEIQDTKLKIVQKTDYPWGGKIQLEVDPARAVDFDLKMRIPDWCKSYQITLNGQEISEPVVSNGYLLISRKWQAGDEIYLLPALPKEWDEGHVKGIRVRGGFKIDLQWEKGALAKAVIHSTIGGVVRVRTNLPVKVSHTKTQPVTGDVPNPLLKIIPWKSPKMVDPNAVDTIKLPESYVLQFETKPGKDYILIKKSSRI
jgi:uncharacterized protein